jgi:RNA polymerase sigma-70 factor, ECF subfamily
MEQNSENITELFVQWKKGDKSAFNKLFPFVYSDLKRLAKIIALKMGHKENRTLQTTAILNEVYLKLEKANLKNNENGNIPSRAQFYGLAAKVIRSIIIDNYYKRMRKNKGIKTSLVQSLANEEEIYHKTIAPEKDDPVKIYNVDLLDLHNALENLHKIDLFQAYILDQTIIEGVTAIELAERFGVGVSSIERKKRFALAWLRKELLKY